MTEPHVVDGWPPNQAELVAAFDPQPGTVFAWEDTIYVPGLGERTLPRDLVVHERVHFAQQARVGGAAAWWRRYIDDPKFRLEQEVEAYRAQYRSLSSRPKRERFSMLYAFCQQLGGRMYGNLVTPAQARALITSVG